MSSGTIQEHASIYQAISKQYFKKPSTPASVGIPFLWVLNPGDTTTNILYQEDSGTQSIFYFGPYQSSLLIEMYSHHKASPSTLKYTINLKMKTTNSVCHASQSLFFSTGEIHYSYFAHLRQCLTTQSKLVQNI